MLPGIINGTMIELQHGDGLLKLRTISRKKKSPRTFLFIETNLRAMLNGEINSVCERDIWCCGEIMSHGDSLLFTIAWLKNTGDDNLAGYEEMVCISKDVVRYVLDSDVGCKIKVLDTGKRERTTLDFSGATNVLRYIQNNGKIKRAFIKGLRGHFQYNGVKVKFCPYGKESFFFDTEGGGPICGGFVMSEYMTQTKAGMKPCRVYGVHT